MVDARKEILDALEIGHNNVTNPLSHVILSIGRLAHQLLEENIELKLANEELENQKLIDELTNIHSRTAFTEKMQPELEAYFDDRIESRKFPTDFLIMFADLNDLKTINDTCSHAEGDKAIIECARILSNSIRNIDWVSRHGEHADEFIIVIRLGDEEDSDSVERRIIERIQTSCAVSEFKGLSIAIGSAIASEYENLADTIQAAEKNMYANKDAVKNSKIIDLHTIVDISE